MEWKVGSVDLLLNVEGIGGGGRRSGSRTAARGGGISSGGGGSSTAAGKEIVYGILASYVVDGTGGLILGLMVGDNHRTTLLKLLGYRSFLLAAQDATLSKKTLLLEARIRLLSSCPCTTSRNAVPTCTTNAVECTGVTMQLLVAGMAPLPPPSEKVDDEAVATAKTTTRSVTSTKLKRPVEVVVLD